MLNPQLIRWILRIGIFFSILEFLWIEPSITTLSTHPVYCPFHSVLEYKLITYFSYWTRFYKKILHRRKIFLFFDANLTRHSRVESPILFIIRYYWSIYNWILLERGFIIFISSEVLTWSPTKENPFF